MAEREKIANRLASLRKERGLTQSEVGRYMELDFTTVAKQEAGDRGLSRIQALRYATLYRCTLMELFLDPNDVPDAN